MWDKDDMQACVAVRAGGSSGPRLAERRSCVTRVGDGDPWRSSPVWSPPALNRAEGATWKTSWNRQGVKLGVRDRWLPPRPLLDHWHRGQVGCHAMTPSSCQRPCKEMGASRQHPARAGRVGEGAIRKCVSPARSRPEEEAALT